MLADFRFIRHQMAKDPVWDSRFTGALLPPLGRASWKRGERLMNVYWELFVISVMYARA